MKQFFKVKKLYSARRIGGYGDDSVSCVNTKGTGGYTPPIFYIYIIFYPPCFGSKFFKKSVIKLYCEYTI